MRPRAPITGITGQVVGRVRRSSTETVERIAHLEGRITLREGDLLDQLSLIRGAPR